MLLRCPVPALVPSLVPVQRLSLVPPLLLSLVLALLPGLALALFPGSIPAWMGCLALTSFRQVVYLTKPGYLLLYNW